MATFTLSGNIDQLSGGDSTRVRTLIIRSTRPLVGAGEITYEYETIQNIGPGAWTMTLPVDVGDLDYGFVIEAPQVGMRWVVPGQPEGASVDLASFPDFEVELPDYGLNLATLQGYWIVYSDTPPAETHMYGVPVLWIDATEELTPVPVNPPTPAWNDATSQFTVPSGVVGVDYLLGGSTLTQGATVATSGAFPRTVQITTQAQPGYVLLTPYTFTHDFPDPAATTVLTSDAFTGAPTTDITGRTTDATLGGTGQAYTVGVAGGFSWGINGSGQAYATAVAGDRGHKLTTTAHNLRVEFDLVALTTAAASGVNLNFTIARALGLTVELALGDDRTNLVANNNIGGNVTLQSGIAVVPALGHWTLQLYQRTLTLTHPGGTQVFDLSDQSIYKSEATGLETAALTFYRGAASGDTAVIDNLKLTRIGF